MTTEHSFLITYGLHNFVTHDHHEGKHVFTIQGRDDHKMVAHAQSLIAGSYGERADIRIA